MTVTDLVFVVGAEHLKHRAWPLGVVVEVHAKVLPSRPAVALAFRERTDLTAP